MVNKGGEFYDRSLKSRSQENNVEMYSTNMKEKLLLLKDLLEL